MANKSYSDQERAQFLELAQEIGITRAKRQLGFPASWATGNHWCDAAGIKVPIDEIKAQAAAHYDWYKTEELLTVCDEGIRRIHESLSTDSLTPDEQKKLSEAYQKYTNARLLLEGKANSINEHRSTDTMDVELQRLMDEQDNKNKEREAES